MADNLTLRKKDLRGISKKLFAKAYDLTKNRGITSSAPLGSSGDTIILHGEANPRKSQISVRLYNDSPELLITDKHGRFIFYGRFGHGGLSREQIIDEYYRIYCQVSHLIKSAI